MSANSIDGSVPCPGAGHDAWVTSGKTGATGVSCSVPEPPPPTAWASTFAVTSRVSVPGEEIVALSPHGPSPWNAMVRFNWKKMFGTLEVSTKTPSAAWLSSSVWLTVRPPSQVPPFSAPASPQVVTQSYAPDQPTPVIC